MSNTPSINLAELPAAQRAAVEALMQEVSALKEITTRQEHRKRDGVTLCGHA